MTGTNNRPPIRPALLTKVQVAELLGCSSAHVERLRADGKMPLPVRVGTLLRWRAAELEKWVASGCPLLKQDQQEQQLGIGH